MEELEEKLSYVFKNKQYLKTALIHSSYANEIKQKTENNERQEFLGDAVLSLVVANYLFHEYPLYPEGKLTKIRSALVCEKSLYCFSKKIGLDKYIKLGKGERILRGQSPSIIADAFEAVVAAIYLDSGLKEATDFILPFIKDMLNQNMQMPFEDYKTMLQEIIQKSPQRRKIEYVLIKEFGPSHNKRFEVNACLNNKNTVLGSGIGKNKKEAEQEAAKKVLESMGVCH